MVLSSSPQQQSLVSSLYSALQSSFTYASSTILSTIDEKLPPSRRSALKSRAYVFAQDRPVLASFLACQLACSGFPVLLLIVHIASVLFFSFTCAIVVGSICALVFTGMCVGLALLVLVPILIVTSFGGLAVWVWAWIGWYILDRTGLLESSPGAGIEPYEKTVKMGDYTATTQEITEKVD